jgi:hypothetical protein
MLGPTERRFARVPENLGHRSTLALLDAVVEIFERPIQLLGQNSTDASFSRAHESD